MLLYYILRNKRKWKKKTDKFPTSPLYHNRLLWKEISRKGIHVDNFVWDLSEFCYLHFFSAQANNFVLYFSSTLRKKYFLRALPLTIKVVK